MFSSRKEGIKLNDVDAQQGVGCVTLGGGVPPAVPLKVNFNFREGWARLEGQLFHYFRGKLSLCGKLKDPGPYFTEMPERRPCGDCLKAARKEGKTSDTRVSEFISSRAKEVVKNDERRRQGF